MSTHHSGAFRAAGTRHCEERKRRSNPELGRGKVLDCFACARNDGLNGKLFEN